MSFVTDLELSERFAATDVVHLFFQLVDEGRAAETRHLFTPDATLTFGPGAPKPGTIAGSDIPAAMEARQAQAHVTTRHVLSNLAVSRIAKGEIQVRSLLTLFRSENESRDTYPASVADIDDRLIQTAEGWRIRARTITPIFNRAG